MADNSLNFSIKIKDEATAALKKVSVSVDEVGKVAKRVTEEVNKVQNSIVNWSQASQAADMLGQSVQQLFGVCKDLTDAYQVQLVAETQLQTVMKQRMSATDEEIQSIKELASAQQALGVIGDEVQLSGAQQMATFLNEKTSLDALIPAMNNLLAQQKGLNATNQDAVGIGNMMGKAMQGQVDVLQRVGVTFTDAQKSVLQYGTESERAAMLAQVIRDNVGEMNAELAKTDAGKQKQLENTIGDLKEQLGAIVQPAMKAITALSQIVIIVTGVVKCTTAIKSLNLALASTMSVTRIVRSSMLSLSAIVTVCKSAFMGAAVGATTLKVAIRGLMISTGVGAAIAVLTFALEKLLGAADSTSGSVYDLSSAEQSLKQATEAYTSSASDAKAGIDMELAALKKLISGHGDESGKVQELNGKYGEALGYHKSAAEWYDVLIRKSADYCKAIGYEAQAKVLASQKAEKEIQLEAVRKQKQALIDSGGDKTEVKGVRSGPGTSSVVKYEVNTKEFDGLIAQERALESETGQLQEQFDTCMEKMQEGLSALNVEGVKTDVVAMNYTELGKEIESTENKLKSLAPTEIAEINRLTEYNKQLKARRKVMGKSLGLGDGGKGGEDKTDIAISSGSLKALEQQLSELKERQEKAPIEKQLTFTSDIVALEDQISEIKERLKHAKFEVKYTLKPVQEGIPNASPIKDVMKSSLGKDGPLADFKIPKMDIEKPLSDMETWNNALDTARQKNAATIESLGAMGGAMGSLGNAVGGAAGQWLEWGANCMQAIATAIPQIMALTITKKGEATANAESAVTGVASSVASIPWVGPVLAVAAVASLLAAFAGIPKFANGGLAYGPTLGLFGEYAGASNNPEVVAPLNKLKQLIQPSDGMGSGRVEFVIDGRALKGILNKVDNFNNRTR